MNRRGFLRFLGLVPVAMAAGAVAAPLHSGGASGLVYVTVDVNRSGDLHATVRDSVAGVLSRQRL